MTLCDGCGRRDCLSCNPPDEYCDHKFFHLETVKRTDTSGVYQIGWHRTERFFCEKCLQEREIKKSEWSREKPEWY